MADDKTDYQKMTVANLRQLLKDRGIPSTGLTRKAQIVEKLEEKDREESATDATPAAESSVEPANAPEQEQPADDAPANAPDEPPAEAAPADTTPPSAADEEPTVENTEATAVIEQGVDATKKDDQGQSAEPVVGQPSEPSVEPSRLNSEEREVDSRKRKRRSGSPDVPTQDIQAKRAKPDDAVAPKVHLTEDKDVTMDEAPSAPSEEVAEAPDAEKTTADEGKAATAIPDEQAETARDDTASAAETLQPVARAPKSKNVLENINKDLTRPDRRRASTTTGGDGEQPRDVAQDDAQHAEEMENDGEKEDERHVTPALHAASPAIYIRNLKRPLKPDILREQLGSLIGRGTVEKLFLDILRTHALVLFDSIATASRARTRLHDEIWPADGNPDRKELWVDFIPDDKVDEWITEEEAAVPEGRRMPTKKFEIIYDLAEGGGYEAIFQEVGAGTQPSNQDRGITVAAPPRPDPVPKDPSPSATRSGENNDQRAGIDKPFQTLDSLFDSTTAKPKLYFKPVSIERQEKRHGNLLQVTARGWDPEYKIRGRGAAHTRTDEKTRYTFDENDEVVEAGPDFGPFSDDRGGRGGFRGGRGGRGGGYRGGFRGDVYRGRGGGGGRLGYYN